MFLNLRTLMEKSCISYKLTVGLFFVEFSFGATQDSDLKIFDVKL